MPDQTIRPLSWAEEAPHVLLVGGGHAMLPTLQRARRWTAAGARVTLLSDRPYLYSSGMVPELLGGVYTEDEARIDLRRICQTAGVRFLEGAAQQLDPAARRLTTRSGTALSYDVAAFDIGARNPGALEVEEQNALIRTKPLHRILQLHRRVESVLSRPSAALSLVVAGGGAAGVEVALNLTARFAAHGRARDLHLHVAERDAQILPGFPTGLRSRAAHMLRRRRAALHLGRRVAAASEEGVRLDDGRTLEASAVLWATGSAGQPLFSEAGLPCDARGFLRVAPTLQCPTAPHLFAAGDCAVLSGLEDLARVGVHAVKQGPVLRDNLERVLRTLHSENKPAPLERFSPYPITPLILSTGRPEGLWAAGRLWLRGRPLLRLKHVVDRRWMKNYHGGRWKSAPLWRMADARAALDGPQTPSCS